MKFALCNELFDDRPLEEAIHHIADLGYDGIEIAPYTISKSVLDISVSQRDSIRRAVEDAGLQVVGLHWLLVTPEGLHINHSNVHIRRKTIDYLNALVHFCADLGGTIMTLGSPKQRDIPEDIPSHQTKAYFIEALREIGEVAEIRDVVMCLEPLPPSDTNFLNSADEAIRMVKAIDHSHIRMMLDVKSMCSEGKPLPDIIRESAPYIRHFHANDANLKGPGFGEVDFVPIFNALRDIEYSGFVSVEVFDYSPGRLALATKSLNYMKESLMSSR
jgi:sugar phosphate isomerase/epimerase